jgi:CelD/BcsL family acetyltransferase involved in cellulose biosynthesis
MDGWRSISRDWSNLLARSNAVTYFLSWEWLFSWAEICMSADRQLFILAFYEKDSLIGVAPFYLLKRKSGIFFVRELRFLGTPESGSDYLDVLTQKGREKEISTALYAYLHGEGRTCWDQLLLSDMRADSLFLLHFMNRLDEEGRYVELKRGAYCPVTQLPDTEDGLYSMLSPGWRKKFKQDMRVSKRDYEVSHVVFDGSEVEGQLEAFFQMYEEKGGWPGEQLHSILKKLLKKYDGNIPFQLDYLFFDGKPLAALFHFKFNQIVSMYLMAVDKQCNPKISIGNLLVGYSIKNAISSGFKQYDFLKGDERYKFHWSNSGHCTLQLNVWQKRPVGYCLALAKMARHSGKLLLR